MSHMREPQIMEMETYNGTAGSRSFTNSIKWLQKHDDISMSVMSEDKVRVHLPSSTSPDPRKISRLKYKMRSRERHEMLGVGVFVSTEREELRRDRQSVAQREEERHCVNVFCRYEVHTPPLPPTTSSPPEVSGNKTSNYVSLDCEMVGIGANMENGLARVSVVGYGGEVLFDRFVKPRGLITDYRTRYSGVRPCHMKHAMQYEHALEKVHALVKGRVIVGHALHNDLPLLMLHVHRDRIRDTSLHVQLRRMANFNLHQPASLKRFSSQLLGKNIQTKGLGHCSVQDAWTAMQLYHLVEEEWETSLLNTTPLEREEGVTTNMVITQNTQTSASSSRKRKRKRTQGGGGGGGKRMCIRDVDSEGQVRRTARVSESSSNGLEDMNFYLEDQYWQGAQENW